MLVAFLFTIGFVCMSLESLGAAHSVLCCRGPVAQVWVAPTTAALRSSAEPSMG
jgi:hypothetical protein